MLTHSDEPNHLWDWKAPSNSGESVKAERAVSHTALVSWHLRYRTAATFSRSEMFERCLDGYVSCQTPALVRIKLKLPET